jgi:signal peptide peptidase SppA
MKNTIPRIWSLLKNSVWAIRPEKLEEIIAVMEIKAAGVEVPYEAAPEKPVQRQQVVAVLSLFGIIGQRMNVIMKFSGGTSTEMFARDLRGLVAAPEVGSILIDIDSPGGAVFGVPELAQEIFNLRGKKPIVGVVNSLAASAAYWVGSAVDELVVTPSGEVGSIGVYAMHTEFSGANARAGIKSTLISAGRLKTAGNELEPLGKEARVYLQSNVDRYYDMFTAAVAKYRGVNVGQVRDGFGEGGMVGAKDAVKMGMADRVGTFDETLARMLKGIRTGNGNAAAGRRLDDEIRQRLMQMA